MVVLKSLFRADKSVTQSPFSDDKTGGLGIVFQLQTEALNVFFEVMRVSTASVPLEVFPSKGYAQTMS